jgi:amidase
LPEAHSDFRSGAFTCHDLVLCYLQRIKALEKGWLETQLNSILAISTTAQVGADALHDYLQGTGKLRRPLHGRGGGVCEG